jgi:hypothetical protein
MAHHNPQNSRFITHEMFPLGTAEIKGGGRAYEGATRFLDTVLVDRMGYRYILSKPQNDFNYYWMELFLNDRQKCHKATGKPLGCVAFFHTRSAQLSSLITYKDEVLTDEWLRKELGVLCDTHAIIILSFLTVRGVSQDTVELTVVSRRDNSISLNVTEAENIIEPMFCPPETKSDSSDSDSDDSDREKTYKKMCKVIRRGLFPEEFHN